MNRFEKALLVALTALLVAATALAVAWSYTLYVEGSQKSRMTPGQLWCFESPVNCDTFPTTEPAPDDPSVVNEEGCYVSGYDPNSPYCKETSP